MEDKMRLLQYFWRSKMWVVPAIFIMLCVSVFADIKYVRNPDGTITKIETTTIPDTDKGAQIAFLQKEIDDLTGKISATSHAIDIFNIIISSAQSTVTQFQSDLTNQQAELAAKQAELDQLNK